MVFEIPHNFNQEKFSHFMLDRKEVELLILSGPDSSDFLNRLSTVDFKKPVIGSLHGAFLNGQAKLISLFTAWQVNEKKFFFIEEEMFQQTKAYLEQMHFAENLKIETEKFFAMETRGKIDESVEDLDSELSAEAYNWGLPGKIFFSHKEWNAENLDTKVLDQNTYDAVRASYGFPKPLQDLTPDHILIEAPLDNLVDRHKGCYPGQEVIEKIYTYGRVAKKIKKVVLSSADGALTREDVDLLLSRIPVEIVVNEQTVGTLSSAYHLSNGRDFGLATLKRLFYEKHQTFQFPVGEKLFNACIDEGI